MTKLTPKQHVLAILDLVKDRVQDLSPGLANTFEYRTLMDAVNDYEILVLTIEDKELYE